MINSLIFTVAATLTLPAVSIAEEPREVFEIEVGASLDECWSSFTTTKGLQAWVAPLADVDFKVGGKWRANYNKDGILGDDSTIENTILCYDPKRMISLKATGFPKDFPFKKAGKETWSIFYFTKVSETKTKITVVGLGYNDTEESRKMRAFFETANKYSMEQLKNALEKNRNRKPKRDIKSGE